MEGYLSKWMNIFSRWKKLYFILHEDVLIFCDKKGGKKLGSLHLKIASISSVVNDSLRINIHSGTNEVLLKASNSAEKNMWYQSLKEAKQTIFNNSSFIYNDFGIQNNSFVSQQSNQNDYDPNNQIHKLMLNSNIQKIDQFLAQVWQSQAKFDEILSILTPQLDKQNSQLSKMSEEIEKIGAQLKNNVTKCIYLIQEEWKTLNQGLSIIQQNSQNQKLSLSKNGSSQDQSFKTMVYQNQVESFYANDDNFIQGQSQQKHKFHSQIKESYNNNQYQQNQLQQYRQDTDTMFESFDGEEVDYNYLTLSQNIENGQSNGKIQENYLKQKQKQSAKDLIKKFTQDNIVFQKIKIDLNAEYRTELPVPINPDKQFSFWSILKDSIGKDLSKISFPVSLNEPLSMLQKMTEQLHYHDLLNKADQEENPALRLAYVMGFAVSYFSTQQNRTKKPFNPLLHETYEYNSDEFQFVSEQVSHHPPISAAFAQNKHFTYQTNSHAKTSFWGRSMEIKPLAKTRIQLKQHQDEIEFLQCVTTINNIIMGTMYVDHSGEVNFTNKKTGHIGQLILSEKGWNGRGQYEVNGWIKNAQGQEQFKVRGKWNNSVVAIDQISKKEIILWQLDSQKHGQNKQYYHFSNFSINLNNLNQKYIDTLPPTDARFRPDQRALENGLEDLAGDEKLRLEAKQRKKRKENEANSIHPQALWFKEISISNGDQQHSSSDQEKAFEFTNKYFERNFDTVPDIY